MKSQLTGIQPGNAQIAPVTYKINPRPITSNLLDAGVLYISFPR
jgi:hypothetical protein